MKYGHDNKVQYLNLVLEPKNVGRDALCAKFHISKDGGQALSPPPPKAGAAARLDRQRRPADGNT